MSHHRQWPPGRAWLILIVALCWGLWLWLNPIQPAVASIHIYHEQPGQTTLRSRQSLRDQNDLAWQATLFKRSQAGQVPALYLRLVGFPGQIAIDGLTDLQIQTGTLIEWTAHPEVDSQTKALPENVAQYRVDNILQDLQTPIPLTLAVPLQRSAPARLVVAPFVVQEWLELNQMNPEI
jgi:hypothetical protein